MCPDKTSLSARRILADKQRQEEEEKRERMEARRREHEKRIEEKQQREAEESRGNKGKIYVRFCSGVLWFAVLCWSIFPCFLNSFIETVACAGR